MDITQYSVDNYAMNHGRLMDLLGAQHALYEGKTSPMIEDDVEIQRLRSVAETALNEYIKAYSSRLYAERDMLTQQLMKKKSLFR